MSFKPLRLLLGFLALLPAFHAAAGGVTLITHGFNSSIDGWVIGMATQVPGYPGFPGTNFSCYEIAITQNAQSQLIATPTLLFGTPPLGTDSGEIIIKLDWSTLSAGTVPTTSIASTAANALLTTNLLPIGGRTLAELPLHLVGHSRGASVITEMARLLGAQGIWVDHVTTLDPHPVSLFGDPSMKNYANILFADNYWQNLGNNITDPTGQSIPGAYNRQLTNLTGGNTLNHSDVHLWYHGTVQLTTPASDTETSITSTERQAWWVPLENAGTNTGFRYSLLGGGDRLSNLEPLGANKGRIRDGFNQVWELGAGTNGSRNPLPANNGLWPNLLRLNRSTTNSLSPGDPLPLSFYYQFGSSPSASAVLEFALDPDANPYNTNETAVYSGILNGTGTNSVAFGSLSPSIPTGLGAGSYWVLSRITAGGRSRLLYAPQKVVVGSSRQAPVLLGARVETNRFKFLLVGVPGQLVAIQASSNLVQWISLQTNVLPGSTLEISDPLAISNRYYRARLLP
ncbi:MAG TPA: hypothetical protein VN794_04245 [Methylomirabilota bacterium]|nr:hypothetical protein [Methylomirabilota bacterium]